MLLHIRGICSKKGSLNVYVYVISYHTGCYNIGRSGGWTPAEDGMAADWHCCGCDDPNNSLGCDNHEQRKCACFHCRECGSTEHEYPLPTCRHSGSGESSCRFCNGVAASNNSYFTQYGTLLIRFVAEMADGTVRGTCGTAVDAGTNRTWTAESMRQRSAVHRALLEKKHKEKKKKSRPEWPYYTERRRV